MLSLEHGARLGFRTSRACQLSWEQDLPASTLMELMATALVSSSPVEQRGDRVHSLSPELIQTWAEGVLGASSLSQSDVVQGTLAVVGQTGPELPIRYRLLCSGRGWQLWAS